jgi:hypothetical protein
MDTDYRLGGNTYLLGEIHTYLFILANQPSLERKTLGINTFIGGATRWDKYIHWGSYPLG